MEVFGRPEHPLTQGLKATHLHVTSRDSWDGVLFWGGSRAEEMRNWPCT